MKKEIEKEEQQKEIDKLQENFDEMYQTEYEEAKYKKPLAEVTAYFKVYGHYPAEHPLAWE